MNIPNVLRTAFVLSFTCCYLSASSSTFPWHHDNFEHTQEQAYQQDKLFFLFFTADWCMPCQWMEEHTFTDQGLSKYVSQHYLALKVDIDQAEGRSLQNQYDVELIPSILVFDITGRLIAQRGASQEAEDLQKWFKHLNVPAHHLHPQMTALADTSPLLSTPRANVHFSKPALRPDHELSRPTAIDSPPLVISSSPPNSMIGFAPRSALHYSIRLDQKEIDYSQGVRLVQELERTLNTQVEMSPSSQQQGYFDIIIGNFSTTGQAQEFLLFLQRNNRTGKIIPLATKSS